MSLPCTAGHATRTWICGTATNECLPEEQSLLSSLHFHSASKSGQPRGCSGSINTNHPQPVRAVLGGGRQIKNPTGTGGPESSSEPFVGAIRTISWKVSSASFPFLFVSIFLFFNFPQLHPICPFSVVYSLAPGLAGVDCAMFRLFRRRCRRRPRCSLLHGRLSLSPLGVTVAVGLIRLHYANEMVEVYNWLTS